MAAAEERGVLFVAADDAAGAREAAGSAAGAVILDLEDLLAPARKASGRAALPATYARRGAARQAWFVRVNPLEGALAFEDLETAAALPGLDGVVVPKLERPAQLAVLDWMLAAQERHAGRRAGSVEVIGIVETAAGFAGLGAVPGAAGARPLRLGLGTGDLARDLGLHPTADEAEVGPNRAALAVASRAAGLPPIDCVWLATENETGLAASARRGRSHGLRGKFCLTARQAAVVRARAAALLAAFDAAVARGEGALRFEGEFVDSPVAERYRALLREGGGGG